MDAYDLIEKELFEKKSLAALIFLSSAWYLSYVFGASRGGLLFSNHVSAYSPKRVLLLKLEPFLTDSSKSTI